MRICLSQACTMSASFFEDLEACAGGGVTDLEVWLTKLEKHLEEHDLAATRDQIAERQLRLAAAAYQGGLLLAQGEQRKAHFQDFRKRLELCQAFHIPTLLVVADFTQAVDPQALERAVVSLKQAAQWAAGFGVTLALEFRAGNAFCACLDTAVKLIQACDEPNLGVCLDAFHFFTGPSKEADWALLSPRTLAHVQLADLLAIPRELASDADRILPGDGDLPLVDWLTRLKATGYNGAISLEMMNPVLWQSKPAQVVELGAAALRRVLAEAGIPAAN